MTGDAGTGQEGTGMEKAGTGAAIAVLLVVLGLMSLVGLILVMMWFQPGIEHSPSQAGIASVLLNNRCAGPNRDASCCRIPGREVSS